MKKRIIFGWVRIVFGLLIFSNSAVVFIHWLFVNENEQTNKNRQQNT